MNNYSAIVNGSEIEFTIDENGIPTLKECLRDYSIRKVNKYRYKISVGGEEKNIVVNSANSNEFNLLVDGVYVDIKFQTALQKYAEDLMDKTASLHRHQIIKSPMPGMVLQIKVEEGLAIKKGESVMILEAMKMENEIKAPADGIVKQIFVSEGTPVEKNAPLFEME